MTKVITGELRKSCLVEKECSAIFYESIVEYAKPILSQFLRREFNKGSCEVTGDMVNRGAGYGLEIPCVAISSIRSTAIHHTLTITNKKVTR